MRPFNLSIVVSIASLGFVGVLLVDLSAHADDFEELPKEEIDELTFVNEQIESRLQWYDKYARSVAEEDWYREWFGLLKSGTGYSAKWATTSANYSSPSRCNVPRDYRSLKYILLSDPMERDRIIGLRLYSDWRPADQGWHASVTYCSGNYGVVIHGNKVERPIEEFRLAFEHCPGKGNPNLPGKPYIRIGRGCYLSYEDWFFVDGLEYHILVKTWDASRGEKWRATQPDAEIRNIMASAESFRDYSVSGFERLANKIETDFANGSAISKARETRVPEYGEKPWALEHDRPMTQKEKEACLVKARAEIQDTIRVIKEHYEEMYTAANKALPLLEMIGHDK